MENEIAQIHSMADNTPQKAETLFDKYRETKKLLSEKEDLWERLHSQWESQENTSE